MKELTMEPQELRPGSPEVENDEVQAELRALIDDWPAFEQAALAHADRRRSMFSVQAALNNRFKENLCRALTEKIELRHGLTTVRMFDAARRLDLLDPGTVTDTKQALQRLIEPDVAPTIRRAVEERAPGFKTFFAAELLSAVVRQSLLPEEQITALLENIHTDDFPRFFSQTLRDYTTRAVQDNDGPSVRQAVEATAAGLHLGILTDSDAVAILTQLNGEVAQHALHDEILMEAIAGTGDSQSGHSGKNAAIGLAAIKSLAELGGRGS